ncbi:FAD-dependent oxidoreductase [Mucilaginibacter sp. X5P1]|uniref:FAD-dependent oxidoreductase n=1 Tax=Mucilaginibacter sp. X5P1 TaxID=2723088 RepID=UPI00161DCFE5|nr:NAD(P)/FAD-dependent oxidoreductase [Mucilaginibacter sp. X5P1]MBB6141455.1 2-polyprenyl-6-methoxyphenol hydroxylase-like FAD-dependent oxidoreductase [Mucilaginibacter sp. X5P1]
MLLKNKKVAIVGGGPGGLTLARLLQLQGADIKVYERDVNENARVQGATLDLHHGSGLKALEVAGLMDAFKATYRPGNEKGRVIDKHANIIYDEHNEVSNEDFNSASFRPEIDRGPLRDMLLNSLEAGTVVWNSQLLRIWQVGNTWKMEFKNGTTATADLIIGADGANSKVRLLVTPVKPFYSGVVIVQGNIENAEITAPNIHQLLKDGKIYGHGDQKYIHVSSKGDGSIDFYISCKKDENWMQTSGIDFSDRVQVCDWFKEEFPGWDEVWLELIENSSLPLLLRPQYCIPSDQTWDAQSNITLLGDAAHIMPPSGEGVNLAMLDALELCECLVNENFKDLQSAIAAYEERMRTRAAKEAEDSLEMVQWMHAEDALNKIVQMLNQ